MLRCCGAAMRVRVSRRVIGGGASTPKPDHTGTEEMTNRSSPQPQAASTCSSPPCTYEPIAAVYSASFANERLLVRRPRSRVAASRSQCSPGLPSRISSSWVQSSQTILFSVQRRGATVRGSGVQALHQEPNPALHLTRRRQRAWLLLPSGRRRPGERRR